MTEQDLRESLGNTGEVISANIVRDRYSGKYRGFGFVEMGSEEDAQKAIRKLNGAQLAEERLSSRKLSPKTMEGESYVADLIFGRRGRF